MTSSVAPASGGRPTQHARLAQQLVDAIAAGRYAVGERLPTEAELCATHGLARGTVRQALRHLEDQGLISRRPGAGTTVIAQRPAVGYEPVVSSRDEIVALYRNTRVVAPVTRTLTVDDALSARLGTQPASEWVLVEGARRMRTQPEGKPLCWTEQYLRPDLSIDVDVTHADSTAAAMTTHRIEQAVRATLVPERFAAELESVAGAPALEISRRHLDAEGELLSVSLHTHPGDRFAITSVLVVDDSAG